MLFTIAFALFSIWLVGMVGLFSVGDLVHVFLAGLMLLLPAFLRARDAAARRAVGADRP